MSETVPQQSEEAVPAQPLKYEPMAKGYVRGVGIVFGIVVGILAIKVIGSLPFAFRAAFSICYVVLLIGFVGLRLKRSFFDTQSRTVEWLAAIAFAGILMAIGKAALHSGNSDVDFYLIVVVAILSIAWAFGGAVWGWHIARRMNEQNGRRRLMFMLTAWVGVLGIIGLTSAIAALVVLVRHLYLLFGYNLDSNLAVDFIWLFCSIPVAMLILPVLKLDRAAPLLASQRALGSVWKPVIIDTYERCRFGPSALRWEHLLLNLTGFNLVLLPLLMQKVLAQRKPIQAERKALVDFPNHVAEFFTEFYEPLRTLGFQHVYCFRMSGPTKNTIVFASSFCNPALGQSAAIVATYVLSHKGALLYRCALDFTSRFSDEQIITTNACDLQFPFNDPNVRMSRYSEVHDPDLLHRVHCARLKKMGRTGSGDLPVEGHELAELKAAAEALLDKQLGKLTSLSSVYVATWSIVWPASIIRGYLERRRARAELAELGF